MRVLFILSVLMAVSVLSEDALAERPIEGREQKADYPSPYPDACYGDRYESDNDLNEGNRITDEEINRLLNRPIS